MPIWRVTINSVKAERSPKIPRGITVEVKPSLTKTEVEDAGGAKLIRTDYKFFANYEPKAGKIEIEGSIYFIKEDPKKVMKDGKLTDVKLIEAAYQRIFLEPTVLAMDLAKDLLLPLPLKMPKVSVKEIEAAKKKK